MQPFEFFNQAWSRPKYQHMCPNVMAIINLFNDVSNWAGSAITTERYVKNRARVMEKFIFVAQVSIASHRIASHRIASPRLASLSRTARVCPVLTILQHLRELNNYHLLTAIVSGLNSSAILRLKWTKERLSKRAQTVHSSCVRYAICSLVVVCSFSRCDADCL